MNNYEAVIILSAKAQEEATVAFGEKMKEMISQNGELTNVDEWGKKKLAYEIQKMKEGYYYFIQFDSDADCPNELEKRVRILDNVIRYLCVRQEEA